MPPLVSQGPISAATISAATSQIGLLGPTLDTPFGPMWVPSAIRSKWEALATETVSGGESVQAYLGWPLRIIAFGGGGHAVYFERGIIVLRHDGGCYVVSGPIYLAYAGFGDVQPTAWSPGLPTSDEVAVANGRVSHFDGADIYWSQATGAHEVHGAIRDHWNGLGGVTGFLGYPMTDESPVLSGTTEIGRTNLFQGGSIYWSTGSGAWEIHGDLRAAWLEQYGGPTGVLGWPVSDESSSPSGNLRYNDFTNGCLAWPGNRSGIRMLTGVDVYLDRFDSRGAHSWAERHGFSGVWLYVNTSVTTSTAGSMSERFPGSGHWGANATPQTSLITVNPVRGTTTIDVSFDGWDALAIDSDVHLGTVTGHFDLDTIFNNPAPELIWGGDFYVAYSVRNLTPADPMDTHFRQDLFWNFKNPITATLSREQFGQTFSDVQGDEQGSHWFDDLFYDNIYKGLAANGNCFGMCLEANDALARMALYSEPLHDVADSGVSENEINLKHGYQVGASIVDHVVGLFLAGATHDPMGCFNASLDMYNRNDFPIISITHASLGGSGHAVRPYHWDNTTNPNDWVIFVANPNEPAPQGSDSDGQNTIHINPANNSFTFAFGAGDVWSGDGSSGGRMFALPFSIMSSEPRTPFWETLLALIGGAIILLGGSATTQQISDDQGRTFYKTPAGATPTRWDQINEAAKTRIPGLARVPLFHKKPLNRASIPGAATKAQAGVTTSKVGAGSAFGPNLTGIHLPVPELYRIQGVRPYGTSPAEHTGPVVSSVAANATARAFGGAAIATPAGKAAASIGVLNIGSESPAAGSSQIGGMAAVSRASNVAAISQGAGPVVHPVIGTGPVGELKHEVAPGSGDYTWAIRSAGISVAAAVPGGAQTADMLSLSKPGAAEQALSITLGTSAQPRAVNLTLANSAGAGQSKIRVFNLSNVSLEAGQAFTAGLTSDGSQIVLENAGGQVTLSLEIRAGLGAQALVSRPSVILQAGTTAVIQPDSWDPLQIAASPVTMSVLDKVGGTVLQQIKLA